MITGFVSLSSRSVLHKESEGGTLLAENSTPNGGDGVPDQRGDPKRCVYTCTGTRTRPLLLCELAITLAQTTDGSFGDEKTEILTHTFVFVHVSVRVCVQNECVFEILFWSEVGGRYDS